MYEARALSLGGWGVFQGVVRLETFHFRADAVAYADRKNRVNAKLAEEAEAVYTERRQRMALVSEPEVLAADIRATFTPGVR